MLFRRYAPALTLSLAGLASGLACTAILAPKDDVQRCGTADDCDATGDTRYVAECRFDDGNLDLDTTEVDKICVAAFKVINCDPTGYPPGPNQEPHPFQEAVDTLSLAARYTPCDDNPGVRGCPPEEGVGCAEGLVPRDDDNICDTDPDPKTPALRGTDFIGQDVLDQFCKGYFCDDSFVCDDSSNCVQCDEDLPYGEGGCGTLFIAGARSCAYVFGGDLEDQCAGEDASTDDPLFGTCS